MADSLSELTMHWSCAEHRGHVIVMDTSRVDGVKAPHNGTPRSHHYILVLVERDTGVERVLARDLNLTARCEGVGGH